MAFHVKRPLADGASYAFVSDSGSVDTAIVYVHGFIGDAQSTWELLQYYTDRLPGEPFRDVDLFFYGYQAEQFRPHKRLAFACFPAPDVPTTTSGTADSAFARPRLAFTL